MAARVAHPCICAARVALLGCGLLAVAGPTAALAAWSVDSTYLSEGRSYVIRQTLDADHTIGVKWALTPDGIISYDLNAGLLKVLAPTGSGAHPLYDPICALRGGSSFVAGYDAYDGRLKYFGDTGSFQDSVLAPTGDASGAGLITRVFNGSDGPVAASYSFADHCGRVLRFSRDGYLLSTYASDASSPGRWDWIFDVASYSTGFLVYVYEGDGITGGSWIEYRAWDGHLVSLLHQRPEYSLPPYWYCSRSLLCPFGKSYFYLLAPGTGPGLTNLVVSSFSGAVLHERVDLRTAVAEPWLRLGEFGPSGFCVFGQYTDARRPGHAYLLDANGAFTSSYQQTPGPFDKVYHPRGILPSPDGSFLLADTDNYRLNGYSSSASFLLSSPLPARPGALAVLPDGSLLAVNLDQPSDPELGGLLHISPSGYLLDTWGPWGTGAGDLAGPSDVAVGPDGNVYVADALNSRVQVFTPAGTPLRRWGSLGESPGGQFRPRAIAVTADRVFTVEDLLGGGSRVLVVTTTGAYVREWSTPTALADLEVTPALALYGLATSGSILTFDELGRALEVSATVPPATGDLLAPAAFRLSGDRLYVADTGNSRVVTFLQTTPLARVVSVGPALLPLTRGVRVTILGDQLPSDLAAQLLPAAGAAVTASVTWLNPGEAVATFDLSAVHATAGDLWVSGTGLPPTNAGTLTLSAYVAPALVGRWQRRTLDVSGNPDGPSGEMLTISPTGQVTWQRLDGTGQWRTGVLAVAASQVSLCYTSASPPLGPWTIAHTYAISGRSLTLTPLPPFEADGVSYWSLVDGADTLVPALSGLWSLTGLDEGSGPVPVTWAETMTVDLSGAYLHLSDRSGSALTSLGQMQAHDGQITRTEARATSAAVQVSQIGSYDLSTGDLHVHIATPQVVDEVWHRLAESGRRPLPWITVQLPPRLYRGLAATAVVTLGNHGSVNATQVVADLALPWLASPQRVVTLTTLGPGETRQYSVAITPAVDHPLGPVVATATATVASPESSTARASATASLADPMLDLSVSMSFPTTTAPNWLVPAMVTLRTSGSDPAAAIPPDALNTVALTLTRSGAIDVAGGDWTVTSTSAATIKWSAVLAALAGKTEVTWKIWLHSKATVGAVAGADLVLAIPAGVADASSEDNTAHGSLTIAAAAPPVAVNLQPLEGAKPGGQLSAFIRFASAPGETWKLRGVILEVDPALDLYAAIPSSGASFDHANGRVSWTVGGADISSDPSRNLTYTQFLPIPSSIPVGTTLTLRAFAYFDNMAPVVSADATLVVTGGVFGDFNGDSKLDSQDLILFLRAYRNARQGIYDPAFDLAPAEGSLPSLVSHPDGVIDYRDAQLFLDAFLFRGN